MKAFALDQTHDRATHPERDPEAHKVHRKVFRKASSSSEAGQQVEPVEGGSGFSTALNAGLVARAAEGSGHALPGDLRGRFEQSLGADLSGVRVHTDGAAAAASSALDARAYAVGQDVYMGAGQYNPSTPDGAFLLAHEVAHTVQQQGASSGPQCKLEVSEPGDAMETDADSAAEAMILGQPTSVMRIGTAAARKIMRFSAGEYRTVRPVSFGDAAVTEVGSRIGYNGYLERFISEQGMVGGAQYISPGSNSPVHIRHGQPGAFRVRLVLGYEISRRFRGSLDGSAVMVASVDYHFNPDGSTTFEITGTDDSSGIIEGGQPAGMQIRRRITVPPSASGAGPYHVGIGWVFDGGQRSGSTASVTSPSASVERGPATITSPTGTVTSGQRTTAPERESADYNLSVVVDGVPAPAPATPPANGQAPINITNTNNNTATGGSGGSGGSGGAGGAGGNATATGGSAVAQGGSAMASAPQPGPQPGPQPQPQSRPFDGPLPDGGRINLDRGDHSGTIDSDRDIERWVRGISSNAALLDAMVHGRIILEVAGFASRVGGEGANDTLSRERAQTVMTMLRRELRAYHVSVRFTPDSPIAMGERTSRGNPNAASANEQRVEWNLVHAN